MSNRELTDAVVVITGATSGIGQASALLFADQGARLVLAGRNVEALRQVAAECQARGAQAIHLQTDVGDAVAMDRLAKTAVDHFGRMDVWVNNAGVGAIGPFTETPMAAHEQIVRTNLLGYMHGAHAALPYFLRQASGVLINNNSLGGWVPAPYAVAYTASKFGLRGFSESLRGELSEYPQIHVCDVFPAFIDTPGLRHAANYIGREIRPLPPVYDPYRVAHAIVSLAQSPRESVMVGASGVVARIVYSAFPKLVRRGMGWFSRQHFARARRVASSDGNLFEAPRDEPSIYGGWRKPSPRRASLMIGASVIAVLVGGLLVHAASGRLAAKEKI